MPLNCGVGEDSWESLGQQETQPVHVKRRQSWIFIGRTDAEAETPITWLLDVKHWLIWKDPDVGKNWRWEDKARTEDEMVGWYHRFNGHEFWVNSGSCWWTGMPGMVQSIGSQRFGHDWLTELNWWYKLATFISSIQPLLERVRHNWATNTVTHEKMALLSFCGSWYWSHLIFL